MAWTKIKLVMLREYVFNFRRPAFLFTAFGVPLISFVAMFVIFRITVNQEEDLSKFSRVGYIDRAEMVSADALNTYAFTPVVDPSQEMPVETARGQTIGEYYNALEDYARQQLVDGNLDAYFVIGSNYVVTGRVDLYSRKNVPQKLMDHITTFMRDQIAAQASGLDVPVTRLDQPGYTIRDLDTGKELSDAALAGRLLLPFIFVMVYFMATNTTAQFLMSGVVEEKENRLMEILATSLRPAELLWGKLLGLGALALTQVALWAVAGVLIAATNQDAQSFVSGARFAALDVALIAVMFIINFFLFSAIMLGIGAAVTAEAESRQIAGILVFAGVLPIALLATFFSNPNGPLPMFFTFFPLTAAVGLILRMGLTTLPAWQIALSVTIQVVSVLAVMWLATKVFRLGMLMYGKPLTPRTLWTALREGRVTLTTATEYGALPAPRTRRRLFGKGPLASFLDGWLHR
jgi:ABC-2 type transport system permease protein